MGPDSVGQIFKTINVGIVCSAGCSLLRAGSFFILNVLHFFRIFFNCKIFQFSVIEFRDPVPHGHQC